MTNPLPSASVLRALPAKAADLVTVKRVHLWWQFAVAVAIVLGQWFSLSGKVDLLQAELRAKAEHAAALERKREKAVDQIGELAAEVRALRALSEREAKGR